MSYCTFFNQLLATYGETAAKSRLEIYFLSHGRGRFAQAVRGLAALARDCYFLFCLPKGEVASGNAVAVVTLAGANGWKVLQEPVRIAQDNGLHIDIVWHPRLKKTGTIFGRPDLSAFIDVWKDIRQIIGRKVPGLSRVLVITCLMRHVLWKSAWRKFLGTTHSILILHNDFDMMSRAAVEACRGNGTSICIQHGIPTDEFFPSNAIYQIVWGQSSRVVFEKSGLIGSSIIEDSFGRRKLQSTFSLPPEGICLVSQTHTPVYGIDLRSNFLKLAEEIADNTPNGSFRILLHPEEVRHGHPYIQLEQRATLQNPPHHDFTPGGAPSLMVGFSSTALIDAAIAGHYVLGVNWEPSSSKGAALVASPPLKARTGEEIVAIYLELCNSLQRCQELMALQQLWISQTFTDSNGERFCELLEELR